MEFLDSIGAWFAQTWPFSWIVSAFAALGRFIGQNMWLWDRITWKWLWVAILAIAIFEFFWWGVVVRRAKEVGYDPHKCTHWKDNTPREHPIKLQKALYRRHSWPRLGLPLIVVAACMFVLQLANFSHTTYAVLALLWFFTAPIRVGAGLAVARRVYHRQNPGKKLATTWWQDVRGYYGAGLSLKPPIHSGKQRLKPQPPFYGDTPITRLGNTLWRVSRSLGRFWQVWRLFGFLRLWRLLGHLIASWAWPITVLIAPFAYMEQVEDLQYWWQPWWRAHRHNSYGTQTIEGEVVAVHDEPLTDQPTSNPRSPRH